MLQIGIGLAALSVLTTAFFPIAFGGHRWWNRHPERALWAAFGILAITIIALAASFVCLVWCLGAASGSTHHSPLHGAGIEATAWAVIVLIILMISLGAFRFELAMSSMIDTRRQLAMLLKSRTCLVQSHQGVDVAVIRADASLAFCVAGASPHIIVSDTLVERLSERELDAVVSHELEHLERGHGTLKILSEIVASWCPWLPASRSLRRSVKVLIELAADDRALREVGADVTAAALQKLDTGSCAGAGAQLRATRLLSVRQANSLQPHVKVGRTRH